MVKANSSTSLVTDLYVESKVSFELSCVDVVFLMKFVMNLMVLGVYEFVNEFKMYIYSVRCIAYKASVYSCVRWTRSLLFFKCFKCLMLV